VLKLVIVGDKVETLDGNIGIVIGCNKVIATVQLSFGERIYLNKYLIMIKFVYYYNLHF
jgi:hypothetical protein